MSLWFGVLLVPLMFTLGRRSGGRWAGLGAALGAAFLPFLLGEAQETRMYTVALVWLACAGLGAWSGERGATVPKGLPWLLFALFSALALLTHYAAVFALVALWGWALGWAAFGRTARSGNTIAEHPERSGGAVPATQSKGAERSLAQAARKAFDSGLASSAQDARVRASVRERWPRLRTVLLSGVLTALLCLPGLPVALRQIPSYRNPNLVVPSVAIYLAELARVYGLGEHLDAAVARPWMWALAAWLVAGLLLAGTRGRGDNSLHALRSTLYASRSTLYTSRSTLYASRSTLYALTWAILPLVVYYLVIRSRATFATRYISFALPGWLLLTGYALRGWASLRRWAGALAAVALVAILAPGLRGDLLDARFFREDTRGVVEWLTANTDPQRDLILVDQRYPFGFYYPRWNNDFAGTPPAEPAASAPAQYLFVDINTVADRLTALAADGRSRVYWVRWFESDTDPRGAVTFLLQKFGTFRGERSFRGYNVSWYDIAPAARFELAPALAPRDAAFGGQVALTGATFGGRGSGPTPDVAATRRPIAPADRAVWAVVRWARQPDARQPLKATLVLEAADGAIVGRDDRPIVNDRHLAPDQWAATDRPLGAYLLYPDPATPPGTYTLRLAVYDPATLAQLPVSGASAQGGFVTLGQVTLTRADAPASADRLALDARYAASWQGVRLLGRGPLPATIGPGDRLAFDLYWQSERSGPATVNLRLTLAPVEGGAAFSQDAEPVAGYSTAGWAAGEVLRGGQRWQTDPALPNGRYRLSLQLIGPDGMASPAVELGQLTVAGRPHSFAPPTQMDARSGARLGDFARLLGYRLQTPDAQGAGSTSALTLTLFWQAEGASDLPYTVSAQLLDATGVLRAQRDQQPAEGAAPTTGWLPGEIITDTYRLDLPADVTPGAYQLILRLYDPATMTVLAATGAGGETLGDSLPLGQVQLR